MTDTLKQIADNLGASAINGSYLNGIADHYGVDLTTSTDLMKDILTAVGGNPAMSSDYFRDMVLELGATVTINANWMEAWEAITNVAVPVNTVAPVLSSLGLGVNYTLLAFDGSWTNSPTSFTYQWYRVPETGGSNDPIIGETADQYVLQAGDEDYLVTCQVTAINATGSSTPEPSDECYVYDQNYYDNVYTNGYDGSTAQSYLQNRLMMGLKTSGAYAKLDYFNIYAIDGEGSALLNWVDGSSAVNQTATFIPDQGYDTGVNAGYIFTNFNLSTQATHYTLNNASRYVFPYALTAGPLDGLDVNQGNNMFIGSTVEQRINQGSNDLPTAFDYTTDVVPKSIHRTNANTVRCYNNLTSTQFTIASTSIENDTQVVGSSDGGPGNLVIAAYAMGASMVAENTAFIAAYDAYINAI